MADHTISLSDMQEATLLYAARQAGKSAQLLLEDVVARLLSDAASDLNMRLDRAVDGLVLSPQQQAQARDYILRAILGQAEQPDPDSGTAGTDPPVDP